MDSSNQHFSEENADQHTSPARDIYAPTSLLSTVLSRLELEHGSNQREIQTEDLLAALQNPHWDTRAAAVRNLGKLGEQAPVEPLLAALDDESWVVRAASVHALSMVGERVPVARLLAMLSDRDWHVRESAVFALGALGERVPRAALLAALDDSDSTVREAARFVLNGLQSVLPTETKPVSAKAPVAEPATGQASRSSQPSLQVESGETLDAANAPLADEKQGSPGTFMPVSTLSPSPLPSLYPLHTQRERPHSMNTDRKDRQISEPHIRRRMSLQHILGTLATVAVLALIVGSLLLVFNVVHQKDGKQAHPKTATSPIAITPTVPPTVAITPTPIDTRPQNLYIVHDATVFKLDARTRAVLWSYTIGGSPSSPEYFKAPIVVDSIAYVLPAPQTSTIYALDANKGTLLWKFTPTVAGQPYQGAVPTIANGVMYVGVQDYTRVNSGIYALNVKTGIVVHFYRIEDVPGLVTVLGNVLYTVGYVSDSESYVDAINIADGSLKFRVALPSQGKGQKFGDVVAINGMLYLISSTSGPGNPSYVYALDAQTGHPLWHSEEINGPLDDQRSLDGSTELRVVDGVLYFDNPYGSVYALNVATGSTLWQHEIGAGNKPAISDPVQVSNGVVYVAADLSASPGASSQCSPTVNQASSTQTYILALGAKDGVPIWCHAMGHSSASFVVIKQVVYAGYITETQTGYQMGVTTGMLQALNATNSADLWQETLWHTREQVISAGDEPLPLVAAP